MFKSLYKPMAIAATAAIALTSVAATPSYAVDFDPGATAIITPTGDWLELMPGESHLYQFNFDYMEDDGEVLSEAMVELEMGHEDSVSLEIYTPQEVANWANGDDLEPIGRGAVLSEFTGNENHDNRLIWANRSVGSALYYVVVENNRTDIASYYEIEISGPGVSFPQVVQDIAEASTEPALAEVAEEAAALAVAETAPEAPSQELIEQVAAMSGGYSPYDAVSPTEGEVTLAAGETRWYTFNYDYDDSDSPSEALAILDMEMPASVSFEVWTQNTVREWVNGDEYHAIGAGTNVKIDNDVDSDLDLNTLQWVGSSKASEQYFIVVENETDQAVTFSLSVTGEDVKF